MRELLAACSERKCVKIKRCLFDCTPVGLVHYYACLVLKFIVHRNPYLHASHLGLLTDLLVDLLQLNL